MESGSDDQQLIEKTDSILRKRFGVSPDPLGEGLDAGSLTNDLEEIHNIARRVSHHKVSPATLSVCNIFLSRTLVRNQGPEAVANVHRESLENFITKKGSKITPAFFLDFINRLPLAAWEIRRELIQACASEQSVNTYRQLQAVQWTSSLLNHILQVVSVQPLCDYSFAHSPPDEQPRRDLEHDATHPQNHI